MATKLDEDIICPPTHLEKPDRVILCYDHYMGGVEVEISDTTQVQGVVWDPADVPGTAVCRPGNPAKGSIHAHHPFVPFDDDAERQIAAALSAASAAASAAAAAAASVAAIAATLGRHAGHRGPPRRLTRLDDDSLLPPTCYWVGGQLVCC